MLEHSRLQYFVAYWLRYNMLRIKRFSDSSQNCVLLVMALLLCLGHLIKHVRLCASDHPGVHSYISWTYGDI